MTDEEKEYELQKQIEQTTIKNARQEDYIEYLKEGLTRYKMLYHESVQQCVALQEVKETKRIYKAFVTTVLERNKLIKRNRQLQREMKKLEEQQAWLKARYQEELDEISIRS